MQHPDNYAVVSTSTNKEGSLDTFKQTVPVENNRVPKSHTADTKTYMNLGKTKMNKGREKG